MINEADIGEYWGWSDERKFSWWAARKTDEELEYYRVISRDKIQRTMDSLEATWNLLAVYTKEYKAIKDELEKRRAE